MRRRAQTAGTSVWVVLGDWRWCGAHVPPTSSKLDTPGSVARKGAATAWICLASSRVGDTMTAPTCSGQAKQWCAGTDGV